MNRREFVTVTLAGSLLPFAAANAGEAMMEYSREAYEGALASGAPILLDFSSKS